MLQPPPSDDLRRDDSHRDVLPALSAAPAENPPWSGWDVVLIAVLGILALFIGALAFLAVVKLAFGANLPKDIDSDARFLLAPQLFGYAAVVGFAWAMIVRRYRLPFWQGIRWNWPAGKRLWTYVGIGLGLALFSQLAQMFVPVPTDMPFKKVFSNTASAWAMSLFGVLVAPFVEELFFRGLLYPSAAKKLGMGAGVAVTSVLFALMHAAQYGYHLAPLAIMLVVALTFTLIRAISRSVAAALVAHTVYNLLLVGGMFAVTGGFRHMERLQ